ncbi:MAG: cytochrome c biogenesis protein CcdA [Patescibacteria group bacterium]|nr:cytochrome c biogenesis protein CcdA [Patescibacteria group bacterium]
MKYLFAGILILLFFVSAVSVVGAQEQTCAYFFYGTGCPHCAAAKTFLDSFEADHSDIDIQRFEIYFNRSNAALFNNLFDKYGIPPEDRGVPALFIGEEYILGDTPIGNELELSLINNRGAECPIVSAGETTSIKALPLLTVIGAAVVDSVNPCAIAVLLILFSALLAAGDKKRAVRAGLAFTLSIYIAYFLFGLGLFSALRISGLSFWFYKIVGAAAIVIGLLNLKDYFWYGGGGFAMEIPQRWRPKLKSILNKTTSPLGAFFVGFLVTLFELPCTGGPYIVILGLLAEKMTRMAAIPTLLLYNLFFILPLLLITFLLYGGFATVQNATEWKDRNIRRLHLFAGVVMLGLGAVIVSGLV